MTKTKRLIHRCARVRLSILLLLAIAAVAWPQSASDFSGLWKQDNDRCQPKRGSYVTLRIDQSGPELTVETSISHGSLNSRHAVQDSSLVFSIEEHEEGRILRSRETWSLIDNGATLQRTRESLDGEKQILIFHRPR